LKNHICLQNWDKTVFQIVLKKFLEMHEKNIEYITEEDYVLLNKFIIYLKSISVEYLKHLKAYQKDFSTEKN